MKIRLVDVDSKIPNLALMKISAYHKMIGDDVGFFKPELDNPDKVYASKVFDFSKDYEYFPDYCEVVRGGSAYNLDKRLPEEVELMKPDYDLYGGCEYSLGRFTRGCPNRCPWCIVWKMDGNEVREVAKLTDFWDERHDVVRILDDNIMADPDIFAHACEQISSKGLKAIWEALDIRLVNEQTAKSLGSVKTAKRIHFAWDSPAQEDFIGRGIELLKKNGIKPYRLMFYVLVGFNTTKEYDMYRIRTLADDFGVDPYVCCYDKSDRYQKDLARWCNNKRLFKTCAFEEYDCPTNRGEI